MTGALAFLAAAGYQLSGIEQAVAEGTPWTGDTEPGDPLATGSHPAAGPPAGNGDPASLATETDASSQDAAGAADPGTPDSHPGDTGNDTDQTAA